MNVKNLNIWKPVEEVKDNEDAFLNAEIAELNLGVRSFNCLKRSNCNTIKDILNLMDEDGQGLRKVRNLGLRSEKEILEKIEEFKEACITTGRYSEQKKTTIIKPARSIWDRKIEEFNLSHFSFDKLKACGINKVGDLYATNPRQEPGWYAVRELFAKIPSSR